MDRIWIHKVDHKKADTHLILTLSYHSFWRKPTSTWWAALWRRPWSQELRPNQAPEVNSGFLSAAVWMSLEAHLPAPSKFKWLQSLHLDYSVMRDLEFQPPHQALSNSWPTETEIKKFYFKLLHFRVIGFTAICYYSECL